MPSQVLVTGHRGLIGPYVVAELERQGHVAVGFDLTDGLDVRELDALCDAAQGCDFIVHLAAADDPLPADSIVDTILIGTKNVLDAAIISGVERVVIASSVDALGIFMGEAPPKYLPIDDPHPAEPLTPYGAAKRAMELLAERTVDSSELVVICLRPPGVCDDAMMTKIRSYRAERASYEWDPIWEYSAWIHAEDLARAFVAACFCPVPPGRYACVLVAAADVNSDSHTGPELAALVHPTVTWRGDARYNTDPRRSLIESGPAVRLLGWQPQIRWTQRT
jgi:nucleoside-diphosphate-sugar epimerase